MKQDISALAEQLTDLINSFSDNAGKQARRGLKQARENADAMISNASERGSSAYDAAHDAAYSFEESLEDVIQERPLATVGIALGIGFLLGAAWKR